MPIHTPNKRKLFSQQGWIRCTNEVRCVNLTLDCEYHHHHLIVWGSSLASCFMKTYLRLSLSLFESDVVGNERLHSSRRQQRVEKSKRISSLLLVSIINPVRPLNRTVVNFYSAKNYPPRSKRRSLAFTPSSYYSTWKRINKN